MNLKNLKECSRGWFGTQCRRLSADDMEVSKNTNYDIRNFSKNPELMSKNIILLITVFSWLWYHAVKSAGDKVHGKLLQTSSAHIIKLLILPTWIPPSLAHKNTSSSVLKHRRNHQPKRTQCKVHWYFAAFFSPYVYILNLMDTLQPLLGKIGIFFKIPYWVITKLHINCKKFVKIFKLSFTKNTVFLNT
jgi:hypothetical protein